ncbi:MAG: peptidoglycan-binding protein [Candidatus Competibacteraceae bacterium]|nr:peptidoglycan-binding protein [Candidatus Competibacteraceae bacterium]
MPQLHVAKVNDCISSIALEHGFFPDTLWNHPDNADLRRVRSNPNVLRIGDLVVIPDKRHKEEKKPTDQRHRFKRKGFPTTIHLRLLKNGVPRANQPFQLVVDGKIDSGMTDRDGRLWIYLPADAKKASLYLGDGESREEFALNVRHLQPVSDLRGVQQRLNNLGYFCGPENGAVSPLFVQALKRFQHDRGLEVTGENDASTQQQLLARHGS